MLSLPSSAALKTQQLSGLVLKTDSISLPCEGSLLLTQGQEELQLSWPSLHSFCKGKLKPCPPLSLSSSWKLNSLPAGPKTAESLLSPQLCISTAPAGCCTHCWALPDSFTRELGTPPAQTNPSQPHSYRELLISIISLGSEVWRGALHYNQGWLYTGLCFKRQIKKGHTVMLQLSPSKVTHSSLLCSSTR